MGLTDGEARKGSPLAKISAKISDEGLGTSPVSSYEEGKMAARKEGESIT